MRMPWRALAAAAFVLIAASAAGEECLELIGGWWHGPPRAVAADDDLLYYATANSLVVMDVTDPLDPQEMGSIAVEDVCSISVADDIVYVFTCWAATHIIDVSTPTAPREVGQLVGDVLGSPLVVVGDRGYFGAHQLWVVDLSDPLAPADVTRLTEYFAPFAVTGEHLVAFDLQNRLVVLDVANPEEISELGSVELADDLEDGFLGAGAIAAEGDSVFIYWSKEFSNDYLTKVDIRDPSQPTVVGTHEFEPYHTCKTMVVDGDRLYLGGLGLEVFDVSGGGAPQNVCSVGVEASCVYGSLAVDGGWLFGADTHFGSIDFFDLAHGAAPVLAHSIDLPEHLFSVDATGGYAYAAGYHDFRILDLSDPTSPVEAGRWQSELPVWSYDVYGNHAYVTVQNVWSDDLVVLDVSDPTEPQVVNVIESFQGGDFVFSGEHAYGRLGSSLVVYDLEDPTEPDLVGTLVFDQDVRVLEVVGSLLYASTEGSLHIVDVSDPSQPLLLSSAAGMGQRCCGSCDVHGGYAYVLGLYHLHIVDVSVPTAPILLQTYRNFCGEDEPAFCLRVHYISRDLLLIIGGGSAMYDITDPLVPVEVASSPYYVGVQVVGRYIFAPGVAVFGLAGCPGFELPDPPRWPTGRIAPPQ